MYTPVNPFYCIEVGFKGGSKLYRYVFVMQTVFPILMELTGGTFPRTTVNYFIRFRYENWWLHLVFILIYISIIPYDEGSVVEIRHHLYFEEELYNYHKSQTRDALQS